jgi:hypothetical protein
MLLKTHSKGQIAVLKVQLRCYEKNLICSLPTNNEIYYDLILDDYLTKEISRVQIKYCNRKHSGSKNLELNLNSPNSKRIYYQHTDIDLILVYLPCKEVILKYEKQHFHRKKQLTINLNDEKSKWYYKNFIW